MQVETLVRRYAMHSALYLPDLPSEAWCPLCRRLVATTEHPNRPTPVRAHIWPEALGGRDITLSCHDCDTRLGATVDWHLIEHGKANAVGRGELWQRGVRFDVSSGSGSSGRVLVEMQAIPGESGPEYVLRLVPNASNPKHVEATKEAFSRSVLEGTDDDLTMTLTFTVPNATLMNLALLHSAYLAMFDLFGYEWALSDTGKVFRDELLAVDPNREQWPVWTVRLPSSRKQVEVMLIKAPVQSQGFAVLLPSVTADDWRCAIWVPLFGQPFCRPPDNSQRTGQCTGKILPRGNPGLWRQRGHGRFVQRVLLDGVEQTTTAR